LFVLSIHDLPSLVNSILVSVFNLDKGTFFILLAVNSEDCAFTVEEVSSVKFIELVPLAVSSVDVTEGVSGINGLIVGLRLNGLSLEIEVPFLSISSIWSLNHKSVANEINVSVAR
jgi:hypothetical protein